MNRSDLFSHHDHDDYEDDDDDYGDDHNDYDNDYDVMVGVGFSQMLGRLVF